MTVYTYKQHYISMYLLQNHLIHQDKLHYTYLYCNIKEHCRTYHFVDSMTLISNCFRFRRNTNVEEN